MHGIIYMQNLKTHTRTQTRPQKQKVEWRFPRTRVDGGNGEGLVKGYSLSAIKETRYEDVVYHSDYS